MKKPEKYQGFNGIPFLFFRLIPSNCLNWKFTAMITLYFHLQPQYYKYEFHIHFTEIILPECTTRDSTISWRAPEKREMEVGKAICVVRKGLIQVISCIQV